MYFVLYIINHNSLCKDNDSHENNLNYPFTYLFFRDIKRAMPLFGNRIVVGTANYKHIKEKKKEFFERETRLGRWVIILLMS